VNGATRGGDRSPRTSAGELRLGEIVLTAAGLDGAERESYLGEVAAAEPDLAACVRRRLAAAETVSESFLDTPAAARLEGAAEDSDRTAAGAGLSPAERYRLGGCLGEGGMGRVVLAFDRQLGRQVALKFLTHEDPAVLAHLLREARAQARVRHPHVLDVYDSGELDGRPFIAMRYVAGGTLAEVGATLSLETKVRLLVQVAEGLHAAHRAGLLHRDVKPGNVLVEHTPDGEINALVTDFGLATDLGDVDSMAADGVAGTPQYIAPERLGGSAGVVDRRSDVYSLGITMYRLLTGELPFAGQGTVGVLRQVLHQELPPPRQRLPGLPAELEAIILRSTARDPDQRYASARAVAADLQRYLDGEVVDAYAAGLAYRLTRFVLRNKLLAAMAGAAMVLLLAASVAVAVFAWRADAARKRAELRQAQAEGLIDFMVGDLRKKLESLGRLDVLDDVGGEAERYFAAVPARELSEAELLRRSQMLYQIGEVRIRQGDLAGAVAPLMESLALARRLAELAPDDPERLFALGQSQYWVGYVHWQQGDLAAARQPFEAYLATSRRLVEKDPDNLKWRRELSYAHSNLGSVRQAEGDLAGALEQFRATLAIDEELAAAEPESRDAQSELAASHNTVGVVLQDLGRWSEAGERLRAEFEIRKSLLAADPASFPMRDFLGTSHSRLGIHLSMLGEWPAAGEHFEQARAIFTRLVAHDPANTSWRFKLAWSYLHLGRVAFARGDLVAADAAWARQRRLIDELLAREDAPHAWRRTQAIGLYHLALLERARGEPARAHLLGAVEIFEGLAASRPTDRDVHRWLSQSYLLLGSLESSRAAAEAAFQRAEATIAPFARGARDGRVLAPWTVALRCLGRRDEARSAVEALSAEGYSALGLAGLCRGSAPAEGDAP
jgi:tetratricopeptide (TPR) repeat protein